MVGWPAVIQCEWPSWAAATSVAPWSSMLNTRAGAIAERTGVEFELAGVAVLDLSHPRPAGLPAGSSPTTPRSWSSGRASTWWSS